MPYGTKKRFLIFTWISKSNEIAPTIVFFIKGKTENEVRQKLDKTNFIINGVGSYEVKPVGDLLLTINEKSLEMKDKKNHTYSVVCDYSKKNGRNPSDDYGKTTAR
jgi:hypothetical protein